MTAECVIVIFLFLAYYVFRHATLFQRYFFMNHSGVALLNIFTCTYNFETLETYFRNHSYNTCFFRNTPQYLGGISEKIKLCPSDKSCGAAFFAKNCKIECESTENFCLAEYLSGAYYLFN